MAGSRRPEPAAQFLGRQLRKARVKSGFSTQKELANEIEFERTVVEKAEIGARVPTPEILDKWCLACGLDSELFADLAEFARSSSGPVPQWFESWLVAEERAAMLKYWSPLIVTPIFHTHGYARALLLAAQTDTSAETIDEKVQAKLKRAMILDQSDPPEVTAVIDELALYRLVGSSAVMYEQLNHVAQLAERSYISIQIVPAEVGATAALSGDISIAISDGSPDVLHTDAVPEGHTTVGDGANTRSQVRAAMVAFERTRQHALSHAQSCDLILKVAEERWNMKETFTGANPASAVTPVTVSRSARSRTGSSWSGTTRDRYPDLSSGTPRTNGARSPRA